MKRLIAIVLLMSLILCGCSQAAEPTTEATTEATTVATTEATEPTTEATEPPVLYRHPLTGAPLDAPFTGRPVSVSIGNTREALPQLGISHADIFYEIEAEGGITRFLPIFTDYQFIENIGPIRSARTFFNNVSASYDAAFAHCGGSVRGIRGYHDLTGSKIPDWVHIDQMSNGSYFFRDSSRRSAGYALEHTLCTTGEKLIAAMTDRNYLTDTAYDYGFQFAEDEDLQMTGEAATKITVSFLAGKTSTFQYDSETGLYSISQYDRPLIDGNNDQQLTFKNVIMIYSPQTKKNDGYYHRSYYELIGEGTGYFAVNGQIVPIKWSRSELKGPFSYTLEDGTPITLGVGTSYVGIASPKSNPISYE